jgi:transposase
MSSRGSYRRHSGDFKHQLCPEIRAGEIGRRGALRTHCRSTNLLQLWLSKYDRGDVYEEVAAASVVTAYEAKSATLGRNVGRLTMEIGLLK